MFKTLLVNYHPKHQVWACCCLLMLKVISNRSSKKSIGSKIHSMLIGPVFKCPTSVMKIMFTITRLPPWALQDLWCKRLKSGTLFQSDFLSQAMWFYIKTAQFALNIMCKDKNCRTKTEMEDARNHGWRVICSDQTVQKKENTLDTVDTTLITYLNINQSREQSRCKTVLSVTSRLHQTTENSGFYCYTGHWTCLKMLPLAKLINKTGPLSCVCHFGAFWSTFHAVIQ